ncbi:MAG: hypothetical protein HY609_06695 [Deltaproteobacteria bacterium]|nr:hypothetical protein [Deltaproteobacteria bacterium]
MDYGKVFDSNRTVDCGLRTCTMKLGVVPYLNSFPLTYGLNAKIYQEVPAKLTRKADPDDIILAPIIEAFQDSCWHLCDGIGIGSYGVVETVKLLFRESHISVSNLKQIYLDAESKTSRSLLKILLQNFYHRPLNTILFSDEIETADGALVIGDKIWNPDGPWSLVPGPWSLVPSPWSVDLGQAWTQWTGLPFVYACWMTRSRAAALEWKGRLVKQAQENLKNLRQLAAQAPPNHCPDLVGYWRRLKYDLDAESKKGIALFQKYWCELEGKPRLNLHWV